MQLYNSIQQQKIEFQPLDPNHVKLYVCGPTVYDRVHLGNARPNVIFDVLYRLLKQQFPKVTYVRNLTDVDDKITARAQEKGINIDELTTTTTSYFHEDMDALGILRPDVEPRATQHIQQMVDMIATLISKGHAYAAEGHVLFAVDSYESYGHLSKRSLDDMLAGARVEVAPYKKNPGDFVLWKPSDDQMPGWDSPWGRGRPGWHIECSAMSHAYLGETFDIHGGGRDLMFPHHENERAQSCAAFGESCFAQTWMHNGMITVNGEKMAKSKGNFLTVYDARQSFAPELIRYALLSSHYRQALDWTDSLLQQAKKNLDRFYLTLKDFDAEISVDDQDTAFMAALLDDLNTPKAMARLMEIATKINTAKDSDVRLVYQKSLKASAAVLGLLTENSTTWLQADATSEGLSPDEIESMIEARKNARASKDFAESDRIRDELLNVGVILEDGPSGTTWRRG